MTIRFALLMAAAMMTLAWPASAQTKAELDAARSKLSGDISSGESSRLNYRARLERSFLEDGISADVFVEAAGDKKSGGQWPRLIVFTYLDKAFIFKLVTDAKILDNAKAAGFKMVQFTDKGREGQWFFDLTVPGTCDTSKRICF